MACGRALHRRRKMGEPFYPGHGRIPTGGDRDERNRRDGSGPHRGHQGPRGSVQRAGQRVLGVGLSVAWNGVPLAKRSPSSLAQAITTSHLYKRHVGQELSHRSGMFRAVRRAGSTRGKKARAVTLWGVEVAMETKPADQKGQHRYRQRWRSVLCCGGRAAFRWSSDRTIRTIQTPAVRPGPVRFR